MTEESTGNEVMDTLYHKIREKQYYALLSVENVCFNDREFNQSLGKYTLCCELLNEKTGEKSLDELEKMK